MIVQKFEITDSFAGYIPALLPFGALLLTPVFGSLFDKKGKGASIMILGSILLVCVHLLFAIPSLNSFPNSHWISHIVRRCLFNGTSGHVAINC